MAASKGVVRPHAVPAILVLQQLMTLLRWVSKESAWSIVTPKILAEVVRVQSQSRLASGEGSSAAIEYSGLVLSCLGPVLVAENLKRFSPRRSGCRITSLGLLGFQLQHKLLVLFIKDVKKQPYKVVQGVDVIMYKNNRHVICKAKEKSIAVKSELF